MKSFVIAVSAASALSLPLAAFSQTDAAPTRAQVHVELQQIEQPGYDPARGEDPNYPADIQAATARVSTQNGATAYGGVTSGSSASGSRAISQPASADELRQLYSGGQ